LGIKDWTKLKQYHNEQAGSGQQTSDIPYAGFILQTPPKDEIYTMNGETPPPDPVEEQKSAEQKQDQEKKKEEEEKKEEKASKSDHDGKYFVVHNAKCVCDKAENQKQTADLQVTTHSIIVLNDEQGKLAATEEDKTFIPPAATFGKCKLKPSSGGYLPCALAPAPKWSKTYESTQVMGKNTLTEISELQCTVGGKITIFKHGQTDSVSNAHADNTNPVELAMVNPAIEQPKKKEEYPSVTSIILTKVENRTAFKEIDSKNKSSIIYLRKDEEASFKANLKSGNKQLTSWMVYSDHQGKKENRIFLREQIGTEFSQSFEGLGKFRIEGYGKPKNQDFEKGKYDKCDPSCSIDVEVVENTLIDIECTSADFTTRIDPSKNRKFRKGVPSVFKAKFFIPDLTAEEKSKLTLSVQDGSGNTITEGIQENGEILTFTPKNTKAKYTITARFTNDKGEVIEKQIAGETEGNAVLGISHGAEVVRPGTPMSFSVSKMKYKFGADNSPYDLTSEESSEIKWNLNGIPQGTGKSFTIAGSKLMAPGKYVVEAYSISANATGKNAKKEDDDWHFEVKENDVVSFTLSGTPKVGKPITATVDKMVFADLLPNETVHWQGFSTPVTGKSITFTPKTPGTLSITSKIKGKGVTQKVNVVVAKIIQGFWNDFGGSEISHAAWGQKVDFCVKGENIEGEEIELAIYDSDNISGDDLGYSNTENKLKITGKNDKTYASHRIELTKKVKDRTANDLSSEVKLYGKAKLLGFENSTLKDITPMEKTSKYLTVNNEKTVYRAIIGEQNGRARHMPVDYDIISWVYASTTYPKGTKLKIKIFEDINWAIDQECKELLTTGTVVEDGTLAAQINWSKLKDAKQNKKTKKYYAIIYNEKDNELLNGSSSDTLCNTTLIPKSILLKEASYTGAVIVGSEQAPLPNTGKCVCKEYDLVWGKKVSCEFRKKVIQIAKNLGLPQEKNEGANWLMTIMALESAYTFNPKIGTFGKDPDESKSNKYVGLIQFGKGAATDIGTTRTHLMSLTAEQQLEFVEKHFKQKKFDKLLISRTALYLAVNYPNSTKHASNKNYVVYDSSNAAYDSNDLFKREKHEYKIGKNDKKEYPDDVIGSTYVWEMEEALEDVGNLGKSHKATIFECGANNNTNENINAKDIVTYHIYENGTIEKHIPKNIKEEYKQKYKYIYHDKEKNEHEICIVEWFKADKRNNGQKISSIPKGYINTYNYPSGGNAQTAYEYSNGDICVSGTKYGYRKYSKGQGKVPLVKMKDSLNYKKNDVKIFYSFQNSQRRYCNPDAYAGFIGALAKLSREDVLCTGMCFADATSYPSVTHPNGDCADTAYYSTLELEQKKVNAFKAFHFEKIYRGSGNWYSKLTGTNYSSGHEDHLHSGEFNTNIIKTIEEK
jgi:hypothetical protein